MKARMCSVTNEDEAKENDSTRGNEKLTLIRR